jgi:hypothetical protein
MRTCHPIWDTEGECLAIPLAVDIDGRINSRIFNRWLEILQHGLNQSIPFCREISFQRCEERSGDVLRGYIVHDLISFGFSFTPLQICLAFSRFIAGIEIRWQP